MSKTGAIPWRTCAAAAGMFALAVGGTAAAATVTYQYDALGRLISSTSSNGVQITYVYDAAGNRTALTTSTTLPIAMPGSVTLTENAPWTGIPLTILGAPATSVGVSTGATHGNVVASGTTIGYIPWTGYAGADSFAYVAANPNGTSDPAVITITVNGLAPIAPASLSRTVAVNSSNNPFDIGYLLAGGTPTSFTVSTAPIHGTYSISGYTIRYTPTPGYVSHPPTDLDSLSYTVSNGAGSFTGIITITVASNVTAWNQFNWCPTPPGACAAVWASPP